MASKLITHKVLIPEGEPPSEFLLIPFGMTETTEGPYNLDESSAKEVISTFKRREIKLFFDYNHLSLAPKTPEDGIAAGWYDIEIRPSGIWIVGIKWTEKAYNHLKSREYAYFSPVLKINKNKYVTRLINVALTNLPATDGIEPIVSLNEVLENGIFDIVDSSVELLDKMKKAKSKLDLGGLTDLKEIIRQMEVFNETMETMDTEQESLPEAIKEVVDAVTDAIIEKEVDEKFKGEQMKEHLTKLDETMDYMSHLGQHMSKMMMEHTDDAMKSLYGKAHGLTMKMAEMFSEKRKEMDPHGMYMKKPSMMMYSEDSVKVLSEIEKITEDKGESMVGKVLGYKMALDNVKQLSESLNEKESEVKVLTEKLQKLERVKFVDEAISKHKKLLPKQREWALSLSETQLKSYLEVAPVLSISDNIVDVVKAEEVTMALTESDKAFIAEFKLDQAKYLAEKIKRFGK